MKQIILVLLVTLAIITTKAQTANLPAGKEGYEAAKWKLRLIDNPQQMVLDAPPQPTHTPTELRSVKQAMSKVDAKKLATIQYWDAGSPSYRWNQVGTKVMTWDNVDVILRTPLAWMNIAIYDATILAWKEKLKYKRARPQVKTLINAPLTYSYPCEHTVTAAAAAYVLAYFLPAKGDSIIALARSASQSRIDAGVQFPSDVEAGWKLGEAVARQVIEKAKQDGSAKVSNTVMNKDPKKWTGAFAMGITLPLYSPLVLRSADQFRPAPPPDFESGMKDMKNFKQNFRSRSLAYFWANSGPELYNDMASDKLFEYHMMDDAPAAARVYTVMHTAFHDMAIAVFDAKYAYWGIRPAQYDSTYKPLITTPPFPGYPSGHAAGAATTAAVLEYFFPADAKQFWQMAQDCADSRFYAGIHFRVDNEIALRMGKDMGKYIVEAWMKQ